MLRSVTIVTAVAITGVALAAPAHAAADHVRYEIESNGPISLVTYFDGIGDIKQDTPPGWTNYRREFTNVATYPFYSVSAQTEGTSVTCRLFVNGELVDSNTTFGRYTIADCSDSP
jgi:hypothetical protein